MKNNIIYKSYAGSRKILLATSFVTFICMIIITIIVSVDSTEIKNEIISANELYGKAHYSVDNYNDLDRKNILADKNTISTCEIGYETYDMGDIVLNYYYSDKNFIEYNELEIIEGRLPEKTDEVAVEKWYLLRNGISENMIGSVIDIYNLDTQENEKKTIVGVIKENDWWIDNGNDGLRYAEVILYPKGQMKFNKIYVESRDAKKVEDTVSNIVNNSLEQEIKGHFNEGLLSCSRVDLTGEYNEITPRSFYVTMIMICLIMFVLTLYNAITICVYKWRNNIAFYTLKGATTFDIWKWIYYIITKYVIIGALLGMFLGIIATKVMTVVSYINTSLGVKYTEVCIEPMKLLSLLIVIILVTIFTITVSIVRIINCTSYEMIGILEGIRVTKRINGIYTTLFKTNMFAKIKYAIRSIIFTPIRKIFVIIISALSIVLLFLSGLQIDNSIDYSDNNDNYKYYVNVKGVFNINESQIEELHFFEKELLEICKKNNIVPMYVNCGVDTEFKLEKSIISKEYMEYLSNTVDYATIVNDNKDYIYTDCCIFPYTVDMLKKLYGENNKECVELGDMECIIMNRVCDLQGDGTYSINPSVNSSISVKTIMNDCLTYEEADSDLSLSSIDLKIVDAVDDLLVYPNPGGEKKPVCIIVNENIYDRYFNYGWYNGSFYIDDMSEKAKKELYNFINGSDYAEIYEQGKSEEVLREEAEQAVIMYKIVFILITICTIVNTLLMNIFDIYSKKYDIATLKVIGVSNRIIYICKFLENAIIMIISLWLGIVIAKDRFQYLELSQSVFETKMTSIYLYLSIMISILTLILSTIVTTLAINKISITKDLIKE